MAQVILAVDVKSANIKSSSTPELVLIAGTNFPVSGYAMDAAAREDLYFQLIVPFFGASNTTLEVDVYWYSRTGQTTGAAVFGAAVACITPADAQSVETKAFATATSATATTVNGTARGLTKTTITVANLDSLTSLDWVELDVFRDGAAGGDTLTGDAVITNIYLNYVDV